MQLLTSADFFVITMGIKCVRAAPGQKFTALDAKQPTTIIINNDVHLSVTPRCITLAQDISNFVPAAVE
jgi:hypothetical protein